MKEIIVRGTHLTKEYVQATAYVSLQKRSEEEIIKADYLNLEAFIRIPLITFFGENPATVKANNEILEAFGMTETELWEKARENTKEFAVITSMAEMLGLPPYMDDGMMRVGTNGNKLYGAGILMFPEVFDKNAKEDLYILPSSIHEVIIVKAKDFDDPEALLNMVGSVNATEVLPQEQLGQAVYRYNKATNTITIER